MLSKDQKREYQKEYMRKKRLLDPVRPIEASETVRPKEDVRPKMLDPVRPGVTPLDAIKAQLGPVISKQIEQVLVHRKELGLPEDIDRWQRALEYKAWNESGRLCTNQCTARCAYSSNDEVRHTVASFEANKTNLF